MLISGGRQLRQVPSGYTGHHTAADPAGSEPGPARRARALGCRRDRYACHAPGQARRPHSTTPIPVYPWVATDSDQSRRSVKPSAQPTLVRTQHLPPPAKTARSLRKRGPAGRFLLVPPCVIVCRCRSWRSNRYGQIADSVRAEAAVRGTACFADPRPFCPVTRAPDCSPDWCMPRIPGGRFSAVLLQLGGGLVLSVPAAGARLPDRPAPSHRGRHGGGNQARVATTRVEDRRDTVASGAAPDLGAARAAALYRPQEFPMPPVRTRSGGAGHLPAVDW